MKAFTVFALLVFEAVLCCYGASPFMKPGSAASKPKVEQDPDWLREALRRHNEYRRGFGSPPLILNQTLCASSLAHARKLATTGKLEHSNYGYGENLFAAGGKNLEVYGSTPVDAWYDEIHHYNLAGGEGEAEDSESGAGSFTQIVWKATKGVCISYAASPPPAGGNGTGTLFVVAHYEPAGNVEGEELANVRALTSSPFFYEDSDRAPVRKHLSNPIGSDGKSIRVRPHLPDRSCWKLSERKAEVSTPSDFIDGSLDALNHIRRRHGVPELPQQNKESGLCRSAQDWADYLATSPDDVATSALAHIPSSLCGEIFLKSSEHYSPEKVIDIWYAEGDSYEYNHHRTSQGNSPDNFVRLIWKATEQICVAYAKKENADVYFYVGFLYQHPMAKYDDFGARKANVFSSASAKRSFGFISLATLTGILLNF